MRRVSSGARREGKGGYGRTGRMEWGVFLLSRPEDSEMFRGGFGRGSEALRREYVFLTYFCIIG